MTTPVQATSRPEATSAARRLEQRVASQVSGTDEAGIVAEVGQADLGHGTEPAPRQRAFEGGTGGGHEQLAGAADPTTHDEDLGVERRGQVGPTLRQGPPDLPVILEPASP